MLRRDAGRAEDSDRPSAANPPPISPPSGPAQRPFQEPPAKSNFLAALLGSLDLPGKNFYYDNPLVEKRDRYSWHECPCCVGNIPRTLLMLPTWMYAKSKEFSVRIRLPRRDVSELYTAKPKADGIISFKLNGEKIKPAIEKGYAVITRTWKKGDKIDLVLPMKIQRVKGSDKIAATRGQVALRYGPLMYTAENVDQDINGKLGVNTPLTLEWNGDLLDGVMVIKGWWLDGKRFMAIPYYARNNRNDQTPKDRKKGSSIWLKDE